MEKDIPKPIETLLVEITLALVDQHKGVRGVTLREITRKAGCTHTNVYNYFDSFEDLLWAALAKAVTLNMEYSNQKMATCQGREQLLIQFTQSQVEFALQHPGLYHFIWLEPLNGKPPVYINEVLISPYRAFHTFMKKIIAADIDDEEIQRIADIIHSYVHGEICKLINGRYFEKIGEERIRSIAENVMKIFSLLVSEN